MVALTNVGLFSHALAMLAYLGLAIATLARGRGGFNLWLAGAALATALWAGSFVATMLLDPALQPWISRLQTVKIGGWIGLLLYLLRPEALGGRGQARAAFWLGGLFGLVLLAQMVIDLSGTSADALTGDAGLAGSLFLVIRIAVSVTGVVLSHNLFIGSRPSDRAGLRLMAIGLGGLFLYDLNFYTLAFLLPPASDDLYNIRGAVDALLALLFAVVTRDSLLKGARINREVAFQTVAVSGVGFYLIAMSVLAYGLRLVGGIGARCCRSPSCSPRCWWGRWCWCLTGSAPGCGWRSRAISTATSLITAPNGCASSPPCRRRAMLPACPNAWCRRWPA